MTDKVLTYQSIEFSRMHSGGIERERAGNRVQLEDSTGNPYTASSGIPVSSTALGVLADAKALTGDGSVIALLKALRELLGDVKTLLDGTLDVTTTALQPNVFKTISGLDISTSGDIWTPAGGKKFRLMGMCVSIIGAAGNVTLKDSATTILLLPNVVVATPLVLSFGDGILSATANNVLKATGAALQVMNGTVWGVEV